MNERNQLIAFFAFLCLASLALYGYMIWEATR